MGFLKKVTDTVVAKKKALTGGSESTPAIEKRRVITSTHTRCVAEFFPFKNRDTLDGDDISTAMDTDKFIEDDAIVACSINRNKDSASAAFVLTLKPKKNYYNLLKPGDWVVIYLDDIKNIDLPSGRGRKCIGNINRIARNKVTLADGTILVTYTIHGSGFGKVFERTEIYFHPYVLEAEKRVVALQQGFKISGSPSDFVNHYLDIFLGDAKKAGLDDILYTMLIPAKVFQSLSSSLGIKRSKGSPVSFNDVLSREFNSDASEGFSTFRDIGKIMGTDLWSVMQQACNAPINELFADIRDGKPVLIFRKIPFTKSRLLELSKENQISVPESKILNNNLGFSDHEHFNLLTIYAVDALIKDLTYFVAAAGKLPRIARDATKRFGLRKVERQTEYGFSRSGDLGFDTILGWVDELEEYWFNYYHFENGTIEIAGISDFRLGNFINIPEQRKVFQVEGISYNWAFGSPVITTLTVSHGIYEDGSFIDANVSRLENTGLGQARRRGQDLTSSKTLLRK